jgi:hypothetical protein
MAIRQIVVCDRCTAEPADRIRVDLTSRAMTIDLCPGCQDALQLPRLRALLTDYGIVPKPETTARKLGDVQPVRSSGAAGNWQCPKCGAGSGKRRDAIVHCTKVHGMTLTEASHAIPPPGQGEQCQLCGYLANNTAGVVSHIRSAHPHADRQRAPVSA